MQEDAKGMKDQIYRQILLLCSKDAFVEVFRRVEINSLMLFDDFMSRSSIGD
jgi:hypothetical protein